MICISYFSFAFSYFLIDLKHSLTLKSHIALFNCLLFYMIHVLCEDAALRITLKSQWLTALFIAHGCAGQLWHGWALLGSERVSWAWIQAANHIPVRSVFLLIPGATGVFFSWQMAKAQVAGNTNQGYSVPLLAWNSLASISQCKSHGLAQS